MIIFLYGADTFRSRRFRQGLQDKFRRDIDPSAVSLSVIDGQMTTLSAIAEKLGAGSLFVKKRMVIIENIFKNKKEKIFTELTDYLKKLPTDKSDSDNVIVFHEEELGTREKPLKAAAKKLQALLIKQQYVQEFKTLSSSQLSAFIRQEATSYGKKIGASAATELANRAGGDLWLIAGSLKKLAFSSTLAEISLESVKDMVAGAFDENIFGLTDALSARNQRLALRLLEEQYAAGLSDEYLLTMLIRQFKILLQIRTALDSRLSTSLMAASLKLHPFVVQKGSQQAKNFLADSLRAYLGRLIQLDWQNKTGQGDTRTELTLLISSL